MKGPKDERTALRRRKSSRAAKDRFPVGKALARIEYFEVQRGLPRTHVESGLVVSAEPSTDRITKRAPVATRRSRPGSYAKANAAKARMAPSFPRRLGCPCGARWVRSTSRKARPTGAAVTTGHRSQGEPSAW